MIVTRERVLVLMGLMLALLAPSVAGAEETRVPAATPGPLVVGTDMPWQALTPDMKPPANPSLSIKLAAARGGIASGLILVSGAKGPVSAKAEDLKGPGAAVPVQLRYATRKRDLGPTAWGSIDGRPLDATYAIKPSQYLDALSDTPVADEPIQPVWVTVDVPAAATPGEYQGRIAVQGKTVRVSLSVADFTVPPRGERRLYANVHQSPDSVAFRYGVEPWSDAHFKLLEPSLKLLGRVGCNIMYVPVIGRTYFGQRNGLIVFTRQGEELIPDFTFFDRYLELWMKHVGKPRLVVLNVWDVFLAGNRFYSRNYLAKRYPVDPANPIELTVRGDNGKFEQVSTPLHAKNQKLWKAVVEGVQQRAAKVGPAKCQVMLGQSSDEHPKKDVVECFKAIDPELRWTAWTHGYGYAGGPKPGPYTVSGGRMGLMAYPDVRTNPLRGPGRCVPVLPGPDTVIVLDAMRCYLYNRDQANLCWRLTPDISADSREHGYGPVGLDLWPLPPFVPTAEERADRSRDWTLKLDYGPILDRGQPGACTIAGPQGALSTVRLEALAEGACEAEARLCIELAIAAKKMDALAAKPILVARYKPFEKIAPADRSGRANTICDVFGDTPVPSDWNDSLAALYDLAANAQRAMDGQ